MLKELFYYLYCFLRKFKYASEPAMSAFAYVTILIGINTLTIINISLYCFNTTLNQLLGSLGEILVGIFMLGLMGIMYVPLYSKRHIIFEKYDSMSVSVIQKRKPLFKLYIFLSFLFCLISIVHSRSLVNDIKKQSDSQEKVKIDITKFDPKKLNPAKSY